ncbi:MAG TPA: biotin--[acetyl-CoA-carboxylase] ligase [Thermohalobaculum sp.]|nr:biotin--[acetyl-CoA-carboxylase] ligase [Thermohalobaculum sp.]
MTLPQVVLLDEVDSTNAEARRRAPVVRPLWIAARRQTAARGREGRRWESPAGNLAATLLLPRDDPPAALALLSCHAGLAVAELLEHLAPGAEVRLKWPNDALLNGAKAAGILLESFGGRPTQLAIGIGVNLAHSPPAAEARWRPTSVAAETGSAPNPDAALGVLAERLDRWLRLDAAEGFAPVRAAWLARAARRGQPIEARLPGRTLTGRFEDVDTDGALVLGTADGRRRIAAADIFFPD